MSKIPRQTCVDVEERERREDKLNGDRIMVNEIMLRYFHNSRGGYIFGKHNIVDLIAIIINGD